MTDGDYVDLIRRYWLQQGYTVDCRVTETVACLVPGHKTYSRAIVSNLPGGLPPGYRNGVNGVELGVPCRRNPLWREAA